MEAASDAVMARFHGLPCTCWISTESFCTDSQAALEQRVCDIVSQEAKGYLDGHWKAELKRIGRFAVAN
jgi:trimethylamine:corrinoid methyltransferase-like protein